MGTKNAEFDAGYKSIEKVVKSQKAYLKNFRGLRNFAKTFVLHFD
jgi:hypothetical protein